MIRDLTFFNSVEDLEQLTGLSRNELWEHGANLDDWDYGFCCSQQLHKEVSEEKEKYEIDSWDEPAEDGKYYKTYNTYDYDDPTYQLMQSAENYCVGWNHFTVDGKHYYTVHHS
jgi:hypothetical protein